MRALSHRWHITEGEFEIYSDLIKNTSHSTDLIAELTSKLQPWGELLNVPHHGSKIPQEASEHPVFIDYQTIWKCHSQISFESIDYYKFLDESFTNSLGAGSCWTTVLRDYVADIWEPFSNEDLATAKLKTKAKTALSKFKKTRDKRYFFEFKRLLQEFKNYLVERLQKFSKILSHLAKTLRHNVYIDRRGQFRMIVRFLFKNLDDEHALSKILKDYRIFKVLQFNALFNEKTTNTSLY